MDGDAAFLFMGSYDSLVHVGTVHTFTTELGKEGRMNIYYFIRIIMQNGIRYFQEEACQYNKVNMILVQYFQCFPVGKSWAVRISDGTLSLSARLSTPACALLR